MSPLTCLFRVSRIAEKIRSLDLAYILSGIFLCLTYLVFFIILIQMGRKFSTVYSNYALRNCTVLHKWVGNSSSSLPPESVSEKSFTRVTYRLRLELPFGLTDFNYSKDFNDYVKALKFYNYRSLEQTFRCATKRHPPYRILYIKDNYQQIVDSHNAGNLAFFVVFSLLIFLTFILTIIIAITLILYDRCDKKVAGYSEIL